MRKFIVKFLILILIFITPNLIFGVIRYFLGDKELIIYLNLDAENMVFHHPIRTKVDTIKTIYKLGDLSHDQERLADTIVIIKDNFGFSNYLENKNPEILFIGDSYFHDPGNGTLNGFQKRMNDFFSKNVSYNLGAVLSSDFKVYNELYQKRYFDKRPNFIVLELAERRFHHWLTLYQDLVQKKNKTKKYRYMGFDFIFGNNISMKKVIEYIKPRNTKKTKTKDKEILFLNSKVIQRKESEIDLILNQIRLTQDYLKRQNIKTLFMIVPDKETLYPDKFGVSSLNLIYSKMKQNKINHINLLEILKKNPGFYYYSYDSHWNQNAVDTVSLRIFRYLKSIR
jgi:hypothetical protein